MLIWGNIDLFREIPGDDTLLHLADLRKQSDHAADGFRDRLTDVVILTRWSETQGEISKDRFS